ncbi:MAG: hypothetical protein PHS13_09175 [Firmicutes bacterium]|nr:hypothetical protein [Bacillota bacterium]MDD3851760.1 hypothetical protein [Bacillota bacterium]MDD4707708.1 hypothetical protein [Bacillota bacterium]
MPVKVSVKKNSYYDSVTLMLITKEVKNTEGVRQVLTAMGTELNKELAKDLGLVDDRLKDLTPNDFFIVTDVEREEAFDEVTKTVQQLLNRKRVDVSDYRPPTRKLRLFLWILYWDMEQIRTLPGKW